MSNEIKHIGDLKPDPKNARLHNPRNIGMIVDSLQEVGAARSIVIDEEGNILAGNGTIDAAAEAGIERVQVVDADGETIIAVRRTGLTKAQKQRLALLDNRTAELAEWDADVLRDLAATGTHFEGLWNENEFALLIGDIQTPDDPRAHWNEMPELESDPIAHRIINVYFGSALDVEDFATKLGLSLTDKTKTVWWPQRPE